jgi:tRNA uridine 5-carboxymethylaminomethyl modification enzyme
MRFAEEWRMMLEGTQILFYQEMVKGLIIENGKVKESVLLGLEIRSKSVVLTNGTFLNGLIREKQFGRKSRRVLHGVTEDLIAAGFESGRMKTGTPPSGWTFVGLFK